VDAARDHAAPAGAPTAATVAGGSLINGNTYEFSYSVRQDDALAYEGNEAPTVQVRRRRPAT
jgi:hypothetical protein